LDDYFTDSSGHPAPFLEQYITASLPARTPGTNRELGGSRSRCTNAGIRDSDPSGWTNSAKNRNVTRNFSRFLDKICRFTSKNCLTTLRPTSQIKTEHAEVASQSIKAKGYDF
jgi:hypothetical protein